MGFKRTHDRQRICRGSRKRYRPSRGRRRARELRICSNHRRGWTGPIPRLRGHPHAHLPIFPQRLGRGSQADRMAKPVGIAIWGIHDPVTNIVLRLSSHAWKQSKVAAPLCASSSTPTKIQNLPTDVLRAWRIRVSEACSSGRSKTGEKTTACRPA